MFDIYSDLKMPVATRALRGSKYPLGVLDVGQCFVVPVESLPAKGASSIRAAIGQYRRSTGTDSKFSVRVLEDGAVGVWRVE